MPNDKNYHNAKKIALRGKYARSWRAEARPKNGDGGARPRKGENAYLRPLFFIAIKKKRAGGAPVEAVENMKFFWKSTKFFLTLWGAYGIIIYVKRTYSKKREVVVMSDLREKQLKEAVKCMRVLNILPETIRQFSKDGIVNKSEYNGILYWLDTEEKELVRCFEEEYNALVYHAIKCSYRMNDGSIMSCMDLLYVSEHEKEWQSNLEDLKCGQTLSYNVNDCYNEFGYIMVQPLNGGVARVA